MNDSSKFTVTLDGETVSILLDEARALCPDEVAAMERAGEQVSDAMQRGDAEASEAAGLELQKRMEALLHALAEKAKEQQKDSQQD